MKRTPVPWLILGLFSLAMLPAFAGQGGSLQPQVLYPTKFDVSPPLRSITPRPVKAGEDLKPREIVNREIPKVKPGGGGKYDHVQNAPSIMSTPSPLLSFQGLDSDDNQALLSFRVMPPDTEGDVGPNHYFEWVNLVFKIYDKSGNTVVGPLAGNSFWAGFGGPCETDNDGDPIVLYDHFADRWFVQQFSTTSPYRLCIALSQTNDPTGSYYRWQYVFTNNKFPDYPKVGVWPNAYYVGFNQFLNLSSWSGAGALGLCKADMLAGNPSAPMVYFDLSGVNPNFGNMFPANADGVVSGTPDGIFVEWDEAGWLGDPNDTLRIWYFHLDCANPASSTFGVSGQPNELVSLAAYDVDSDMCGYNRNCIPQQGTTQKVDALSDRLMYPIQYREFPTYKVLVTAQTVDATGTDVAGVHWRELRNSGSGWGVFQAGTYAPADGNHRWMPSAAMDASGNICVGYSVSSSSMYPSAAYACRDAGDPLGTLGNEVIYKVGTGYQSGGNRWGDYSAIQLDPNDDCTFWNVQEFGRSSGSFFWSTYVASFKMSSCVSGPSGVVHGTVTSSATSNPISGAQVQAQGASYGPFTTFTNSSGQYSFTLPPDTYTLTFSAFGYAPLSIPGIVVNNGDDITQDAALTPNATADLDGYIMGQAHGWPLYAKVVVKYSGSPVAQTFTNPFNGYYSVSSLPALYPYTIEVTPLIAGYNPDTRSITLAASGQTENFYLTEDGSQDFISCVLQGGLNENFDGPFPPQGWKVEVYNSNTNNNWRRNDAWGRANVVPGGSGYAAGADSDAAGSGSGNFDTALVTPYIQLPATPRELVYKHFFRQFYSTDRGYVDICVSPCSSWTNLQTFSANNSTPQTVNLAAYAGQTVKIRFRYVSGDWAWYWYIDDVLTQQPAVPPPPPTSQWVENFDSVTPPALPANWVATDVSGTSGNWATATGTVHPSGGSPHSNPNLVYFNSWTASSGNSTRLWKTTTDTIPSGQTGFVGFWMYHDTGYSGSADRVQVQYSTDGGSTWVNAGSPVNRYDGTTGWKYHLIGLTGASGTINVGLLGISGFGNDVHLDEVEFLLGTGGTPPIPDNPTFSCNPVPGTLVEGFVTDGNTGLPVVGATVLNNDTGRSATTVATPADPNIADGFYYLFVPLPGFGPSTRTFTASKSGYGNAVQQVNLPPNTVYQLNFALPAGWLQVSPSSLFSRLYTGQDEHQTLVLTNLGNAPVNYSLFVIPQATTWPHLSPVVQPHTPTPASLGRAPAGGPTGALEKPGPKPYLTSVEAFGVDVFPGGNLVHWNDLTVPGTWNVVAADPNDDFGGDFLLGDFSKLYVLDYTNNQLATIDTTSGTRTIIGPATPVSGQVWTGLTASVSGTLYATSSDCSASTLYTVDPNTGAATVIGPITNAPCAISVAINPQGEVYVVDIANDNLVKVDPTTGAGMIIGSLGFNANYAQGMDFDDVTGTLYWASYGTSTGSGALRVIDTTTGASTLVGAFPGGAEVDALAVKSFAAGVCWLTLTPSSGSVPASSSVNVDAYFEATSSCPPIYGSQRATIQVVEDDPYSGTNPSVCFYRAFNDVPVGHPFDKFIHAVGAAKITQGFGGNFNPSGLMTRGTMARWLLLGRYGNTYSPPPCVGIFADVDCESTPNADWIEDLYNKGITAGCSTSPLKFCPNDPVDRAQMAKFLIKAKEPAGYTPPPCTGLFSDVPCPGGFLVNWIEDLANRGVTSGCAAGLYCPTNPTTRDQMSKFVVKNWNIPTCP